MKIITGIFFILLAMFMPYIGIAVGRYFSFTDGEYAVNLFSTILTMALLIVGAVLLFCSHFDNQNPKL